jgi:hypothetical protein
MTRQLNEIWNCGEQPRPWRAQMKNYVAQFETEGQARRYVLALKKIEEQGREKCKKQKNGKETSNSSAKK